MEFKVDDPSTWPKVELHVHMDGSVRLSTVLEFAKKRNIPLPADNVEDLRKHVVRTTRTSLYEFLAPFKLFMPPITGDREAVYRLAYEFCEDQANQNIVYVEARYSPQLLANNIDKHPFAPSKGDLCPREVVQIVNKALKQGEKDFGITVRSILCCIRTEPIWSLEVVKLCEEFRDDGVVGIDIAGHDAHATREQHVEAYQEAEKQGISRTVHAGEDGDAVQVQEAIEEMHAQRIGHGYHTIDDEVIYKNAREKNIHFECCPLSSYYTSSVPDDWKQHPIKRFAEDGANFSISTDDPTLLDQPLASDYQVVIEKVGLTRKHVAQSIINAAKSSFLEEPKKNELVQQLQKILSAVE